MLEAFFKENMKLENEQSARVRGLFLNNNTRIT